MVYGSSETRQFVSANTQIKVLWIVCLALTVFSVLLLSLHIWDLRLWGNGSIDYQRFGTWSDAISGLGTMLGVLAALGALLIERSATRHRQRDLSIAEETAVYIWFSSRVIREEATDAYVGTIWDLRVENLTRAPIYDWLVNFGGEFGERSSSKNGPLVPGERVFNAPELDDVEPPNCPVPDVEFLTRSQGRWSRSGDGSLKRVLLERNSGRGGNA